jgi:hypothetical protein
MKTKSATLIYYRKPEGLTETPPDGPRLGTYTPSFPPPKLTRSALIGI